MTLLATAARRWKEIRDAWSTYTAEQEDKQPVHSAMVIQVEDVSDNRLTKTDLEQALRTLEQELGPFLPPGAGDRLVVTPPTPSGGRLGGGMFGCEK